MENKKYTLTLSERIIFASILPQTGSYVSKIVHKELLDKLAIKSIDISKYKISLPEGSGMVTWDENLVVDKFEYEFTQIELVEINKGLKQLDASEGLQQNQLSLYEKFILNKQL